MLVVRRRSNPNDAEAHLTHIPPVAYLLLSFIADSTPTRVFISANPIAFDLSADVSPVFLYSKPFVNSACKTTGNSTTPERISWYPRSLCTLYTFILSTSGTFLFEDSSKLRPWPKSAWLHCGPSTSLLKRLNPFIVNALPQITSAPASFHNLARLTPSSSPSSSLLYADEYGAPVRAMTKKSLLFLESHIAFIRSAIASPDSNVG